MAAQPSSDLLTLDEYLQTSFHPDVEFIDDHVEEKTMGSRKHSALQMWLGFWFISHQQEWKLRAMSEVRTRVLATRIRLPDVCLVPVDEGTEGPVQSTPPFIIIEILSPEDRWPRIIPRLKEFLAMGVENIWLLDPIDRAAYTYSAHGVQLVEDSRLAVPNSPVHLDLPELFAALD
jgi:Uma2 family endonuclease